MLIFHLRIHTDAANQCGEVITKISVVVMIIFHQSNGVTAWGMHLLCHNNFIGYSSERERRDTKS